MIADAVIAVFCTLVVAAGWYYLARSSAVASLAGYESPRRNKTRRKVRRMGAWSMIVLAIGVYWMILEVKWRASPVRLFLSLVLSSFAILMMLTCAAADMYLTHRLGKSNRPGGPGSRE